MQSKTGPPALQRVYAAQADIAWSYHHCCRGAAHIMLSEVIGSTLKNTKKTQFKEKNIFATVNIYDIISNVRE